MPERSAAPSTPAPAEYVAGPRYRRAGPRNDFDAEGAAARSRRRETYDRRLEKYREAQVARTNAIQTYEDTDES